LRNRPYAGGVLAWSRQRRSEALDEQSLWRDRHDPAARRREAQVQPWVVVARDADDAALVAARACCSAAAIDAETFRELSDDEVREHALDLANHGMAKALPTLEL
jgi:hypothetical protein